MPLFSYRNLVGTTCFCESLHIGNTWMPQCVIEIVLTGEDARNYRFYKGGELEYVSIFQD